MTNLETKCFDFLNKINGKIDDDFCCPCCGCIIKHDDGCELVELIKELSKQATPKNDRQFHQQGKFMAGDKVRVISNKIDENDESWENAWVHDMDNTIGQVGEVLADLGTTGYMVKIFAVSQHTGNFQSYSYSYPSYFLELV